MKRSEFNKRIKNLLQESINLECGSNTMFLTSIFLANESDRIESQLSSPTITEKEKKSLEKQMANILKKMEWELKFNKQMENKAKEITEEMDKLNKLKEEGKIEDE